MTFKAGQRQVERQPDRKPPANVKPCSFCRKVRAGAVAVKRAILGR